ncbi:hypothetical protein J4760_07945 [Salinicoccus sp. ID82-1]|uniref:hypothetical protein n=1 Tax=Salinicoccus sp. ID82-1 TaxID=2820269 RepID=UPI001F162DF2|nr:hypothetical protein [Salinicoccus sp. ID82-1]MCG1009949.1 hypothetical protein [Salinicoccus sp. ID82-1]
MKDLHITIRLGMLIIGVLFISTLFIENNDSKEVPSINATEPAENNSLESSTEYVSEESNSDAEPEKEQSEETTEMESEESAEPSIEASSEETAEPSTEETVQPQESSGYTNAEHCIMSQLTECENVPLNAQFDAYKKLVDDGTLPQAPGSGCLPCAVKYSFEMKYGESRDIVSQEGEAVPDTEPDAEYPENFITDYLFALPGYFGGVSNQAESYFYPGSEGHERLVANKASGQFANHMTYSVQIDRVEEAADGTLRVYAYREYSHATSDGVNETYTRYDVIEQDGRYYIVSYEELDNVAVQ